MKPIVSSTRRNSGLSCSMSRGESSRTRLTSTSSITALKIFSRGLCWWPTVTQTIWPRSYFRDLSPSRIVAVLRPRFSWSMNAAEKKLSA
jgi:hypothetical protein